MISIVNRVKTSTRHPPPGRTRIKICGVRDGVAAQVASEAGADAVGLVFVPDSPRFVTVDQARAVIEALPPFVEPVGLFKDTPPPRIHEVAAALGLRTVQLHGHERVADAQRLAPLRVIKAIGFDPSTASSQLDAWAQAQPGLSAILWDAPITPVAPEASKPTAREVGAAGGEGKRWDWSMLDMFTNQAPPRRLPPFILAGGLDPQNVGVATAAAKPYAVDVSSGVESQRGHKDAALIRAFCQAVRQADTEARCGQGYGPA